ncbi:MAG: site-2 protease family protein [Verrucomicrobiota bacterium]
MLGWSIPLFRLFGIPLRLHWSFLGLLGWFAWQGWLPDEHGHGGGGRGMFWTVALLLAFFTCVVLHELGHCLTARRFGIGTRRILLLPIGGMADMEEIPRQPSREILMTLAGPAVNFVIAGLLGLATWHIPEMVPLYSPQGLAYELAQWNLYMGLFNLVPVFPMDGGRIFRALLATRLPYVRATFVAATVAKVLASGAIIYAVREHAWQLVALFAFIFAAGEMEYRFVKRREAEAEHWHNWWARRDTLTVKIEPTD